jgi:threonine dehydrogenase-like Zn-dependent dehydrogenase
MEPDDAGRRMGHEFVGIVENVGAEVRTVKVGDVVVAPFAWSDGTCVFCQEGLHTPDVLDGRIQPGRVLDRIASLEEVPDGYRAMNDREALNVMIEL